MFILSPQTSPCCRSYVPHLIHLPHGFTFQRIVGAKPFHGGAKACADRATDWAGQSACDWSDSAYNVSGNAGVFVEIHPKFRDATVSVA